MPASGCAIGEGMHVGCRVAWQWVVVVVVVLIAGVVLGRRSESGAWE